MLVCDMEKYKRPPLQHEPNVYLEPKWLRCPQCCSGLELIGPAHEELETPEAVLGQALRLEVILLSKEKAAAPRPKPRGPRQASRHREANPPKPSKPSTPFKTLQTLQNPPNPPNTFPNRHPRAKATSQSGPQGQGHSNGFLLAFKAAVCQPANTPNAPKPSKHSKHHPKPSKPSKAWRHALSRWPKGYGS